ncbi:hypothetical protein HHK36_026853 [Tetracentron sinense]|uniref:DNA/RNA-binding protein Alba-like domain-containing protein n=1 Tax=Tetracentron sinense TaxID=13715 RepID=A0A835D503_TETSI|nr:hypothetical protein HHK36_026853 [Tetracentron sinense]
MEAIAVSAATATATIELGNSSVSQKKNRIQKYLQQHNEVELSALGLAITTVVTIAEILKNNGLVIQKNVSTSTVGMKDETKGRLVRKAKIEIVLGKSENFDDLMTPAMAAPEVAADKEE